MSSDEHNSNEAGAGLALNLLEPENHEAGGVEGEDEGEGEDAPDSGSAGTESADAVPSEPKIDCLVCKHCKAVISLADHLIEERIDFLNSDVFSYELDIFDTECVFVFVAAASLFVAECAVRIFEGD